MLAIIFPQILDKYSFLFLLKSVTRGVHCHLILKLLIATISFMLKKESRLGGLTKEAYFGVSDQLYPLISAYCQKSTLFYQEYSPILSSKIIYRKLPNPQSEVK